MDSDGRGVAQDAATANRLAAQAAQSSADGAQGSADDAQTHSETRLVRLPTLVGVARSLDSVFQIDSDWPAWVSYVIELQVQAPLLSTQYARVELLHDLNNPTTTYDMDAYTDSKQGAGLLVGMQYTCRQVIQGWIMPGEYVLLASAGGGNTTLISTKELLYSG